MIVAAVWAKVRTRYQLSLSQLAVQRPARMHGAMPLISFSFDDFPQTALHVGGDLLKAHNLRGTYYTAFGLMDRKNSPVGPIFSRDDLLALVKDGHELGCHTFSHCHAWNTRANEFERSLIENREALNRLLPNVVFKTMSYPISVPRPQTKRRTAKYFAGCRGGGQTLNARTMDLNNLRAFFIEKGTPALINAVIEQNAKARGWLIFATHDVCEKPSRFGCTPQLFEEVVLQAVKSGARILPVGEALTSAVSSQTQHGSFPSA